MKFGLSINFKILFAIPVIIGLIGAFIYLDKNSFWYDELFTAWVVNSDKSPAHVFQRILTDLHPPVYYYSVYLYSLMFGSSDAALRSYSAVCACGAILMLIFGLKNALTLEARLFGAAFATGSLYWFFMSQNARSYALCLLIGSGLLVLASRLLAARDAPKVSVWNLAGVAVLAILGVFTHYFMTFEAVAVVAVLAFYLERQRLILMALALGLIIATYVYVDVVVKSYAQFSTTYTWMKNDVDWYSGQFREIRRFVCEKAGVLTVVICLAVAAWRLVTRWYGQIPPGENLKTGARRLGLDLWTEVQTTVRSDPFYVLCAGVPVLVFLFSALSSAVSRPNFSGQNFLITTPFIWCLVARVYDSGPTRATPTIRLGANLLLALVLISMSTLVFGRRFERNEPWRVSAAEVGQFAACRGGTIPVLSIDKPFLGNPGFIDRYAPFLYNYYLNGFATTKVFERDDIKAGVLPQDMRALMRQRMDGKGCPIIAWTAHAPYYEDKLEASLTRILGAPAKGYTIRAMDAYSFTGGLVPKENLRYASYILYVAPVSAPAVSHQAMITQSLR